MFDADFPDMITTDDGFGLAKGAEKVAPERFRAKAPHGMLLMPVICNALASAAAEDGSLLDFDVRAFFDQHVTDAVGRDQIAHPLVYDAFTSMTLMEIFTWMQAKGFLAHRGNGDSYDYWLATPAVSRAAEPFTSARRSGTRSSTPVPPETRTWHPTDGTSRDSGGKG